MVSRIDCVAIWYVSRIWKKVSHCQGFILYNLATQVWSMLFTLQAYSNSNCTFCLSSSWKARFFSITKFTFEMTFFFFVKINQFFSDRMTKYWRAGAITQMHNHVHSSCSLSLHVMTSYSPCIKCTFTLELSVQSRGWIQSIVALRKRSLPIVQLRFTLEVNGNFYSMWSIMKILVISVSIQLRLELIKQLVICHNSWHIQTTGSFFPVSNSTKMLPYLCVVWFYTLSLHLWFSAITEADKNSDSYHKYLCWIQTSLIRTRCIRKWFLVDINQLKFYSFLCFCGYADWWWNGHRKNSKTRRISEWQCSCRLHHHRRSLAYGKLHIICSTSSDYGWRWRTV